MSTDITTTQQISPYTNRQGSIGLMKSSVIISHYHANPSNGMDLAKQSDLQDQHLYSSSVRIEQYQS